MASIEAWLELYLYPTALAGLCLQKAFVASLLWSSKFIIVLCLETWLQSHNVQYESVGAAVEYERREK